MNSKNRKKVFAKLTKNAEDIALLSKIAQEISNETVSSGDADAQAEEYTKKLFSKLWDNTDIHLVGDE